MYNERDRTQRSKARRVCENALDRQTKKLHMKGKKKKTMVSSHHAHHRQVKGNGVQGTGREGEKGYYTVEGGRCVMQTKSKERFRDGISESRH
jgi:hypothetical protein